MVLKTNIHYYTGHTLSNYWFYDPVMYRVIVYVRQGISYDELAAVLQIRTGNRDNSGIIIHIFTVKTYFVTHQ